jgi:hypothetical protein
MPEPSNANVIETRSSEHLLLERLFVPTKTIPLS